MTSIEPRASVVIATKNRGQLVEHAVESALGAKGVLEVILVDDGSVDDTQRRLIRFGKDIEILQGTFGSPAAARNAGAARARGDFLAFLDSDDLMLPEKVMCLSPLFEDPKVGLVHGWTQVIDETGAVDPSLTREHRDLFLRGERLGTSYGSLARHCAMFTSATLIRRSAFEEVGGYDESLTLPYEDVDLYLRMSLDWILQYRRCEVARYRVWSGNFGWESHANGMAALATKHLGYVDLVEREERSWAVYGFSSRLARSCQTLLKTRATRRWVISAIRARPATSLTDLTLLRLFISSFAPRRLLKRRRPHRSSA